MILRALYDYYDRRKADLPPMHYALVNFRYAIVLDSNGLFQRLERLGDAEGLSLLTIRPEERTSSPVAHCMGDNGSYVLGLKGVNPDKSIDY